MLYSKLGSYPKTETDGTEGWVEVPDAPEVPWGKELAWLNNEWIIRDPKPIDRPGYQWNWAHDGLAWIECENPQEGVVQKPVVPVVTASSVTFPSVSFVAPSIVSLPKE
jgi:hypothetical protein